MISINARSAGIGQFSKAVVQAAGGQRVTATFPSLKRTDDAEALPSLVPAFASNLNLHKITIAQKKKTFNLNTHLFNNRCQAITGIGVSHQYRLAHTDVPTPDFSAYKRLSNQSVTKTSESSRDDRRTFSYVATAGLGVGGVVAAKYVVQGLVQMLSPAKDCLALSKVEVNIGNIPEGKNVTVKWRGKPIFIRHRTQKEVEKEKLVNISELRHPEEDEKRAPHGKWLIVIGICTHLGCVPISHKGDFGGFYCPCHGSHYDASGRIRKGPAPYNLEVPQYVLNGDEVVIG